MWILAEDFMDKVQGVWRDRVQGVPMYQVVTKLKKLKSVLKELNKRKFSNIEQAVEEDMQHSITIQG